MTTQRRRRPVWMCVNKIKISRIDHLLNAKRTLLIIEKWEIIINNQLFIVEIEKIVECYQQHLQV